MHFALFAGMFPCEHKRTASYIVEVGIGVAEETGIYVLLATCSV